MVRRNGELRQNRPPRAGDRRPLAARHARGVRTIESVLRPDGSPVLGLYLHTVNMLLMRSLSRSPLFRRILVHLIGTPALLARDPGLSQAELASFLGTERATAGLQVEQCLARGFVRRTRSNWDGRRYELRVTRAGLRMLAEVRRVIPEHEDLFARALTARERATLRRLLMKLIAE